MAERLVDESVAYAKERKQGGRPIAELPVGAGAHRRLTDRRTWPAAALVLQVAEAFDRGEDTKLGPSCAKYFASEMVGRVADRAVQVHGGAGYMRGVAVERFFRDARLFRIYEGTSQIQQVIIAREALARARAEASLARHIFVIRHGGCPLRAAGRVWISHLEPRPETRSHPASLPPSPSGGTDHAARATMIRERSPVLHDHPHITDE